MIDDMVLIVQADFMKERLENALKKAAEAFFNAFGADIGHIGFIKGRIFFHMSDDNQQVFFLKNVNIVHVYVFEIFQQFFADVVGYGLQQVVDVFVMGVKSRPVNIHAAAYLLNRNLGQRSGLQGIQEIFAYPVVGFLEAKVVFGVHGFLLS